MNSVRPRSNYSDIHPGGTEPGRGVRVEAFVPMKRGGRTDEGAAPTLWLLSGDASYTTGTFIDLAGGR